MTHKILTAATIVLLSGSAAFAQSTTAPSAPAASATPPAPTSSTVRTDEQGKSLIGAPLGFNVTATGGDDGTPETVFVLDTGKLKPAGEWTAADRKACSDSGGIELPVSAGRVACFRL